jgi:predicted ATPase
MLTKLEANGFKNLIDFKIDLGAFTCIAGPNGVGKSNVFDAIRFLSALADLTITEAAAEIRKTAGNKEKDSDNAFDIFFTSEGRRVEKIKLAAEMLVPKVAIDDFGRTAEASATFLRYEVEIGLEQPTHMNPLGRLTLLSETLVNISEGDAPRHLRMPHSASNFRKDVVINNRRSKSGYISTVKDEDEVVEIHVHQDGGSRGNPQKSPAHTAPRTIISTVTTSANPTILAARREMQSWRLLSLEPSAMRAPDGFNADPHIGSRGEHLPATLSRLISATSTQRGGAAGVFSRIAGRLSQLIRLKGISLGKDSVRNLFTLNIIEPSGASLPAKSISDGTLRFLALSILAEDSDAIGVICMEEPENGIHPEKLPAMYGLLLELAVNPNETIGKDNPLRQIIIATHSPSFVQLQNSNDLLFAMESKIKGPFGKSVSALRCRAVKETWRADKEDPGVGEQSILAYLSFPPEAQLPLSLK